MNKKNLENNKELKNKIYKLFLTKLKDYKSNNNKFKNSKISKNNKSKNKLLSNFRELINIEKLDDEIYFNLQKEKKKKTNN